VLFPRGEIASSEVLTFEIAGEAGIYSDGDMNAAGASSTALLGAALTQAALASAGVATVLATGAALAQAALSADGVSTAAFLASALIQGDLVAAGQGAAAFSGVTFMANLVLGDDPMQRISEQRDMSRPAEGRAMEDESQVGITRPSETRGMTK
jgi:hypothetical protein